MHLLRLNNLSTAECHRAVGNLFPSLRGAARAAFLRSGTTFLVVRDPFERLVSAFLVCKSRKWGWFYFQKNSFSLQDKLAKLPKSPKVQPRRLEIAREIKNRFRKGKRKSLIPTFPEFVKYVVSVASSKEAKTTSSIAKIGRLFLCYNSTLGCAKNKSREDLKTAWKYLSNEHKNFMILSRNDWENCNSR